MSGLQIATAAMALAIVLLCAFRRMEGSAGQLRVPLAGLGVALFVQSSVDLVEPGGELVRMVRPASSLLLLASSVFLLAKAWAVTQTVGKGGT